MEKKILVLTNSSWNIYNFRSGLIRAIGKEGYGIAAAAPEDSYAGQLDVDYIPIKTRGPEVFILRDLFLLIRLFRLYRSYRPHLVFHFTIRMNIYGSLAARWFRIPCINTISGLGSIFVHDNMLTRLALFMYRLSQKYARKVCFFSLNAIRSRSLVTCLSFLSVHVVPKKHI